MIALATRTQLTVDRDETSGHRAVDEWVRSQRVNFHRAVVALQPFAGSAFGSGAAAPLPAQRAAANALISRLRQRLVRIGEALTRAALRTAHLSADAQLQRFQALKARGERALRVVEKVWEFYFELFNQRQASFADMLMAADRIGTDCYQAVYMNLGVPRSIPSPRPLAYVDTGFGPATFRRGIRLSAIGRHSNPFPLLVFPRTRLISPWTLGAIPHEVGHNIHADLGLWTKLRDSMVQRLEAERFHPMVGSTFGRWHKEIFADLIGVLLIGPAYVRSLMDVVGGDRSRVVLFVPSAVHPTPYLRVPLNVALLRRTGFGAEAEMIRAAWDRLYPPSLRGGLPAPLVEAFDRAAEAVIETMVFTAYPELGNKRFAEVVAFTPRHQALVREGAVRLARNLNTGILPSRFLIAAARVAFDQRLASPERITQNFYEALVRR
ncbi:MAG: hypothetical protein EA406_14560 [Rhodospirillales bacterium]|nr:MAG: hypothetical protein EA406_14560 [Rhodospirillales bacterium]